MQAFILYNQYRKCRQVCADADGPARATMHYIININIILININNAGKFVRMPMDRHGRIVGGFIDHYLLEKSRVTHQACLCI